MGISNAISSVLSGLSTAISGTTGSAAEFSSSLEAATSPIFASAYDLGKTVEGLGYMGLAFDKKGKTPFFDAVGRGRALSTGAEYGQTQIQQGVADVEAAAQGIESFSPMSEGVANYEAIVRRREEEEEERRRKKRPPKRSRRGYARRNFRRRE